MDLAGIEPASESLFIEASPITVAVLTFPLQHAHRQACHFSSFMNTSTGAKLIRQGFSHSRRQIPNV